MNKLEKLHGLAEEISRCKRCALCEIRRHVVFGEGDPDSRVLFLGEAAGQKEDESGRPFIGRSGNLLTRLMNEAGIDRDTIYIANILKCRPPKNRAPLPEEARACIPFLARQIEIIAPSIIVCLGAVPARWILGEEAARRISLSRGNTFKSDSICGEIWNNTGVPERLSVIPTFHPSYLLRNPSRGEGRPVDMVLKDLKKVRDMTVF